MLAEHDKKHSVIMPLLRVVVGDFNKMIQEKSTSKDTLTIEQMQASVQERLFALARLTDFPLRFWSQG